MLMRKLKKKLKRPRSPWDSTRMEEENKLTKEFGLKKKGEIWRAEAVVRNFRRRARALIAEKDERKMKILLERLVEMGLIQKEQGLDQVLQLKAYDVLNRRLQTLVFKKGFATSAKDARQRIVHGHVYVDGRKTTFPSYTVPVKKENTINVKGGSK